MKGSLVFWVLARDGFAPRVQIQILWRLDGGGDARLVAR